MSIFSWIAGLFNKLIKVFKKFMRIILPIAKQIIIAQLKDIAIQAVEQLAKTDLSNEEKRNEAFNIIKKQADIKGIEIRDSLVNLLIEMAVQYLKEKTNG